MFFLLQVHTDSSIAAAGFTVKFYCKVASLQKVLQPPCNRQPWSRTALGLLATRRLLGTSEQGSSCSKQPLSCSVAKSTCFRAHPFRCPPISSLLCGWPGSLLATALPPSKSHACVCCQRSGTWSPRLSREFLPELSSTPEVWWASHEHRFEGLLSHQPVCMAGMLSPGNGMQAKTTRKVSRGGGSRRGSSKCGRAQFLSRD